MGITRLNHAVLYVSDVEKSTEFYRDILGFRPKSHGRQAVFTQAAESQNDHDLALFAKNQGQQRAGVFRARGEQPGEHEPPAGLYHLAWEVDSLHELKRIRDRLEQEGRLGLEEDHGVHKSVYGHDPDGLLFEITWFIPSDQLTQDDRAASGVRPLDFARELTRFGE
ncbi:MULTISPECIES: VOC family protein [Dickeya]|uniref:Biphenyl-2,3-diol 1,2-dioxygenase n=1 Tax=Dickeya aquatica TaxID=1401087 RepID=A0A375AEY7_9GAMM|nr:MULTISPECIES: VOC family protein [Dickeya]SLM64567.1 Biphenyl-2,3-diol 1,2-dioxygenase [Dickeya aquatica]